MSRLVSILAIMVLFLASVAVAHAQSAAPTVSALVVTSSPGDDGGYAIGETIEVTLTFSEAVTVVGTPRITLDIGGEYGAAEYSGAGTTPGQLRFSYTVAAGDEDRDGIAVVANSLARNGGSIRAGATSASPTHAALQANDHKVDGIAPTVTVGGETRTYVPPDRQFNVVFYFSEKVYGLTDSEITVTNGTAHDVRATLGNARWPRYTTWDVVVLPAAEGPVTVTLQAGAATDVYGNGNAAPGGALSVIAADPVTVEVARTTSGFAEGGKAEFTVTRSRDNGEIPVSMQLDQTGDFLSGIIEVFPPPDPGNPGAPATPQEVAFSGTPFALNITFAAGETSKRIAVLTEDDRWVEEDGTVTLSVPANAEQYKYIPAFAASATSTVRDNDVAPVISAYWKAGFHPYTTTRLETAREGSYLNITFLRSADNGDLAVSIGVTDPTDWLDLDSLRSDGYVVEGDGTLRMDFGAGTRHAAISIPIFEDDEAGADGSVTVAILPDEDGQYTARPTRRSITVPIKDDDSPLTVTLNAPAEVHEGEQVVYTLTRLWDVSGNLDELTVNLQLEQTGDYIAWPPGISPVGSGPVNIPVTFENRAITTTLILNTEDDELAEPGGRLSATLPAPSDNSYTVGADSPQTTLLRDNENTIVSVFPVSDTITEGASAQYRFTREGDTRISTRVGLYVTGMPKIMTDATKAIALTSDNEDQSRRLFLHGTWVDYILEFAAGETEKVLSLTTEADSVNEGDGWLAVSILQRTSVPYSIGTGRVRVHVEDDDIPTVSLTMPVGPTGLELSVDGTTWVGTIPEATEFTYSSTCTGVTEFSGVSGSEMNPAALWVLYSNHPAYYGSVAEERWLGNNLARLNYMGADCDGRTITQDVRLVHVGPANGVLEITLVPLSEFRVTKSGTDLYLWRVIELHQQYRQAAMNAEAEGRLITEQNIFHPIQTGGRYWRGYCKAGNLPYCPKYRVGTVNKIRLTITNRDPSILIKAESPSVTEGQPARFILERGWATDLLDLPAPQSDTVVYLRASQDGQYITGALPTRITFGRNETRKVIELQTVDDAAFGETGSVTIELLPDSSEGSVNLHGKYSIWANWLGHTPTGGRSDQATVTIANNDDKPGITIAPAWAAEDDSGSTGMTFTVSLGGPINKPVQVSWATSDGTATAGQDYTAVTGGVVTIPANSTSATFTVSVTGDTTDEPDETFNVTISLQEPDLTDGSGSAPPEVAIVGGDTATVLGTIVDDDPAVVTVAPKKSPVTEGEEVVFVLTRTGVTDEELYILVGLEDPARTRVMIAKFDAAAVTAELSVATENNDVVDYPSKRDYTIQLYGDAYFVDRDDERYTPGDPGEATVTVQDNDTLVVVTVEPVTELVGTGGSVQFRFRRTGSTTEALTISFQGFEHPSSGDATLADASVTFLAGNDTVVYTNDVTSSGTVNPISRGHTVLIYGDAGRGGLHRSWIAGTPNRATVVVAVDVFGPMPVTASYPGRVAADESVSVEYTVTYLGERALSGEEYRVSDGTLISTTPDRGDCRIRDRIPTGESRTCSASFTVTNQDVTNGKIEFNATARNHNQFSTVRVYIRVAQPVEFGFTTADTLEVTEGPDVTATLPVTRTGRLNEAATVAYRLRKHGTRPASLGEDFTDPSSTPGLLTFPANVTSANIVINITRDQIDEERERFRVDLVPLADGTITEGKNSRVVRIADEHRETDPYRPTASLQLVSSSPVPENEGPVEFAVVLNRVWGRDAQYEVGLIHDQLTATPTLAGLGIEGDFEDPAIVRVHIPAGQTRFEFSVILHDDDVREEDETFQLELGSSYDDSFKSIGPAYRALATIADNDRIPPTEVLLSLTRNGRALESVLEDANGRDITVTASFPQIRWPGDASDAPLRPADPRDVDTTVRVQFDPNSGATHAAGLGDFAPFKVEDDQGDFQEVESFDITIPAGQTSGTTTLRFRPVNDDVDEENETATLRGDVVTTSDSEDSLPVRSASFTITDDDTRGITVSPSTATSDGLSLKEGGGSATYSLVLDSQPTDSVTITLAGQQDGFLRIMPDTLTFTASDWATAQTVTVLALDDGKTGIASTQETITHQVSGGDYADQAVPGILARIEDTTKAYIYLEDAQASESGGHIEFKVTVRPLLRGTPVLVRYATVDGTAIAGTDYTRQVDTAQTYKVFTIPAGQSSGTIRIPITDDQVYEPADETFTLQLTNHNDKATLSGDATPLTATGTITDDDPKPVVSVAGPDGKVSYVSENANGPVTFTLTLTGQSAGDVTVDYATGEAGLLGLLTARQSLAGATEDEDYAGTSGTVTFSSGQTTKTFTVQVTNDDVSEDTEFFGFKISNAQNAQLGNEATEQVADMGLLDDDPRGVLIEAISIGLEEPASGETAVASSYTVKLKSQPTDAVTVTIGGGSDSVVTLSATTLTFNADNWATAQTVTVTPLKDANAISETITLTHTLSGGDYTGIAADSVTINVTDSDTRNIVLSPTSLTVTEGEAAGTSYTVKLATEPSNTVTVTLSGHSGTALLISGTTLSIDQLTFTADNWATAQTVTVKAAHDDNAVNESETLTHTASGGDYANVTADLAVTNDDDSLTTVTVQFGAASYTVAESDDTGTTEVTENTVEVTVVLSADPERTVVIPIEKTDQGGATAADYSGVPQSVTFNSGDTSMAFTFTAEADNDDDDGESVRLTFGASLPADITAGTPDQATVTITDDDVPAVTVQFGQSAYTVAEGSSRTVTVELSADPERTVVIPIVTTNQGGAAAADYSGVPGSVTFTSGDTSMTFTVAAEADDVNDDGESVRLSFGAGLPAGVTAGTQDETTVTITDDDDPTVTVMFGQSAYTVAEGGMQTVTVALSGDPERTVVIPIEKTDQGGATTADYSGVPGSVTFNSGDTSMTFTFAAEADDVNDDGESVRLSFGAMPDARVSEGSPSEATVSITDDDAPAVTVNFESATYTVAESDDTGTAEVTENTVEVAVELSADPERTVVIPIVTTNQGGAAAADYSGVPGSVTFTSGDTSMTFTVAAEADDVNDDGESVRLSFGAGLPAGVTAGTPATSIVSITDDDVPAVTVSFGQSAYTVAEGSSRTVTVELSADPERTAIIPIETTNQGGAIAADYSGVPGSVTFNSGDTAMTFTVAAEADNVNDDGESVRLTFGATLPPGVTAGTQDETTVTITDDDDPTVTVMFGQSAYTVAEGGMQTVTVALSGDPERTVVIPIEKTDQGGATAADYSGVPGSVTFNSGDTAQTFTFAAEDDADNDDGESVRLSFGATPDAGVSEGSPNETTVTITDDNHPASVTVAFQSATYSVAEGNTVDITVTASEDPQRTISMPVWIRYQGGAIPDDYSGIMERINLDAGSTSKVITVGSVADTGDNECEQVTLEFGAAPGGVVIGATGSTTIITDPETGTGAGTDSDPKPIRVGLCGIQRGEIASDGAQDWYSFEAAGGQTYIIEGKQPLNFVGGSAYPVNGALRDVSILSVTDNSDSQLLGEHTGGGFTLKDARAFFTPPQDGAYKVSIGAGVRGLTGSYTVSVRADDHADDVRTQAGVVLQPDESVTARLDSDVAPGDPYLNEWDWTYFVNRTTRRGIEMMDDRDMFRYEITNAGTYELYLSGNPAGTGIWYIWDLQGNLWYKEPDPESGPGDSVERHHEPGTYYVEVGTSYLSHANTGASYTLHLETMASGSTGSVRSDAPQTPTSLDVVPYDSGELSASWQAPTSGPVPTGYTIEWKTAAGDWEDPGEVSETGVTKTSHVITGLTDGVEYAVRIVATRDAAGSDPSEEVTATPQDTTPPELSSATVDGAELTLTLNEPLDTNETPDKSAFAVTVAGISRDVDTVAVSGSEATLTLVKDVLAEDSVTVDYTAPADPAAARLQDLAGNAANSFSGQAVTNSTNPAQIEEPSQREEESQEQEDIPSSPTGLQVALHESGQLLASWNAPGSGPDPTGYTVQWKESGNDWADQNDVTGADATDTSHIITGLTDGTEYAVRVIATTDDAGSEPSGDATATPRETTPPELSSASVDGTTLTLTFDEALDTGETPDHSAFTVTVGGSGRGVYAVAVSGSVVSLTLVTAVAAGDTVTVSYTAPTNDAAARVQDLSGNAAPSSSGQAVTNNTAPPQTPIIPDGLRVRRHESGKLLASWNAPGSGPAPTGYTVQWKESGDNWADQDDLSEAQVTGTSHVITGLTDGTEYAVRVIATTDGADSAPSGEVTATPTETTPPELSSASVDGATLTLTFDEALDDGDAPDQSAFTVTVAGNGQGVDAVAVSVRVVTVTLVTAVAAGEVVTVDYTAPAGESDARLRDFAGNSAASFSGQAVTNHTPPPVPLTASAHDVPASHDGTTTFTFDLRLSETPREGFSYKTLRDYAFTVTGGEVVKARRLEKGKNVRWGIHVTPNGDGTVTIVLPVTTDCNADGAVCTDDGRILSNRLEVTVPGP